MGNRLNEIFEALGGNADDPQEVLHLRNSAEKQKLIKRLIDERKRQGLTQEELGKRMSVTQEAVSRFESLGGDPRLSTILRYATALGQRIEVSVSPASSGGVDANQIDQLNSTDSVFAALAVGDARRRSENLKPRVDLYAGALK